VFADQQFENAITGNQKENDQDALLPQIRSTVSKRFRLLFNAGIF